MGGILDFQKRGTPEKWGLIKKMGIWGPLNNYVKKHLLEKFLIPPTEGISPLLNVISKTLNCSFAQKQDFLRKLSNISLTIVYLLFSIILKYFIKNHYSRSRDIRLHNFWGKLHWNFPHARKKDSDWETISKPFWSS